MSQKAIGHTSKGRLLILLNEYSRAQESFGEVTDAFLPVRIS